MMLFSRYKRIIVLPVLLCFAMLKAQDVIEIQEKRVIKAEETLTIKEGTVVKLGPGAFLDVRGTLIIKGSKTKPVRFVNSNNAKPGIGIQIAGIQELGNIQIEGVRFENLIQPIRFDPFWYRKNVTIYDVKITGSMTNEPVVYLASPFIDLRTGKRINVSISDVTAINNASGFLLESFGSNGINYQLNNLYFGDNTLSGGDISMGLLHLDFAETLSQETIEIGNIAFERNVSGGKPLGLSVSGTAKQNLKVLGLYGENLNDIVFDQKRDTRIPSVKISKTGNITEYGMASYISSMSHKYGDLRLTSVGGLTVAELRDANNQLVEITRSNKGDTQIYNYIQGNPKMALMSDGRFLQLPPLGPDGKPTLEIAKIDTAEYNKYLNLKTNVQEGEEVSDEIGIGLKFKLPTFAKKNEIVKKLSQWEIGLWGGGAVYGGGDIKHKRVMDFRTAPESVKNMWLVKGLPVFSTVEYSYGVYGQYNLNTRFSLKGNFYYSSISMHNMYAPLILASGRMPTTLDRNFNEYTPGGSTFLLNFLTRMYIVEVEGVWHLRSFKIEKGKSYKIIPSLGLSLGAMHYTPYRVIFRAWRKRRNTFAEHREKVLENDLYNLRDLGSEGQNFLPGSKPYSSFAGLVGSSFTLTYLRERWALKGEIKVSYTTTDYLDDYGKGNWYGGNVDLLRQNQKIGDLSSNYPQQWSSESNLTKIIGYDNRIGINAPRSTDGLNDWYFQAHLGLSYRIFKK
jgi:hypothetical protein